MRWWRRAGAAVATACGGGFGVQCAGAAWDDDCSLQRAVVEPAAVCGGGDFGVRGRRVAAAAGRKKEKREEKK